MRVYRTAPGAHCSPEYSRSGLTGPCFLCADGMSSKLPFAAMLLLLPLLCVALRHQLVHDLAGGSEAHSVQCVMSFGSAAGGFDFAQQSKAWLCERCDWHADAVYVDHDALAGKEGTVETVTVDADGEEHAAR